MCAGVTTSCLCCHLQDPAPGEGTYEVPPEGTSVDPEGFSDRSSNDSPPLVTADTDTSVSCYVPPEGTSVDPELSDDSLDGAEGPDTKPSQGDMDVATATDPTGGDTGESVTADVSVSEESQTGVSPTEMTRDIGDVGVTGVTAHDTSAGGDNVDSLTGSKPDDQDGIDSLVGGQGDDDDDDDSLNDDKSGQGDVVDSCTTDDSLTGDTPEQGDDDDDDSLTGDTPEQGDDDNDDSLMGDKPEQGDDNDDDSSAGYTPDQGDDIDYAPGIRLHQASAEDDVDSLTDDIEETVHSEAQLAEADLGIAEQDWIDDTVEFSRRLADPDRPFTSSSQLRLQQFAATLQDQIAKQSSEETETDEEMALARELAEYTQQLEAQEGEGEQMTPRSQRDEPITSETDSMRYD